MSNPFEAAASEIPAGNWLDDLARASLEAASAKFFPPSGPESTLTVSVLGPGVNSWETAQVSMALQDATAKIGRLLRDPAAEHTTRRSQNREAVPLIQRGAVGATMFFGFPPAEPTSEGDALLEPFERSLSERAAYELVEILPRNDEDDEALDAMLSRRPTERSAVNDLIEAVASINNGLSLSIGVDHVTAHHETTAASTSVITLDQAATLQQSFKETSEERETITRRGRLDGMRTSRRIFYLDQEDGHALHGAIDIKQIDAVKDAIGDDVVVTLEATTTRDRAGRRGRTTYRLLDLAKVKELDV